MRLALVTGGADGLGREFCRRLLASKKYNVCFGDINREKGQQTLFALGAEFGFARVYFVCFDVSSDTGWMRAWEKAEHHFGMPVYLLVNNAGIGPSAGWKLNVDVMLVGHMKGAFIALERMSMSKGGRGGRIVNVASVAGVLTGNIDHVGYTVAKWGSVAFTLSFANANPKLFKMDGVKAMAICPWFVRTNILRGLELEIEKNKLPRVLSVEEVGEAFLKVLRINENGHVYAIMPNSPLLDIPNVNQTYFLLSYFLGRFVGKPLLGMDVINAGHVAIFLIAFLLLLFMFLLLIVKFLF